jgi:2'-5' RNA ligase
LLAKLRTEAPDPLRLFIAIQIPEEVRSAIEKSQSELRRALPQSSIRWTARDQLHLTLKFLGEVESQRSEVLIEALRSTCQNFAALQLRVQGLGCFPARRSPRVVWVGINDALGELVRLQRALETIVKDFTEEEPDERFTGHATLARIKHLHRTEIETLRCQISERAERLFGEWTAAEIELIRSDLSSTGARHTRLAAIPLRP